MRGLIERKQSMTLLEMAAYALWLDGIPIRDGTYHANRSPVHRKTVSARMRLLALYASCECCQWS